MKTKLAFFLIISSIYLPSMAQNESDSFLNRFVEINQFPTSEFFFKNEIIIKDDTISVDIISNVFLMPLNTIRYSDKYLKNQYYYYGKYKLSDRYYIISCKIFYDYHLSKIISFIYDKEKGIVLSSIEIMSSDFNLSRKSRFENNVLIIENTYKRIPNGLDPPPGKEFLKKVEIVRFKINSEYKFVKI